MDMWEAATEEVDLPPITSSLTTKCVRSCPAIEVEWIRLCILSQVSVSYENTMRHDYILSSM